LSDASNQYVGYSGNTATYTPSGSLAGMTNGYTSSFAGIVTSNVYNDRLQPILLSAGVGGTSIFSLCYDFHLGVAVNTSPCPSFSPHATGDNGNVFQVLNTIDSTRSAAYAYDPLNRIAQANTVNTTSSNCWAEVYTIDAWGNLTNRSGVSGMTGCSTEGLSASASTNNQLSILSYDAAGNVTNDGNGNTPTYDAENRIVTDAGIAYSYDADGVRIEKSSGTMYWPGPSGTLAETSLAGTINEEYIFFNGTRIARVDRPSGTVHYYFSNHLGSHSMVTSTTGSCEQDIDYYPYGGVITDHCPNVAQHYKFTGKERDSESGLDNFGARYNASTMGRFMTPDWAAKPTAVPYAMFGNPQSLNLYSYVGNNPLLHFDPDGHCWPAQSCYQAIANFVNNFSNKVFNSSANSSPAVAALKTFGAGVLADTVKMAASPLTMGTATGTCMGGSGCSAGGTALAVGGDLLKGAAIAGGLSAAAGSLTGAAATDATVLSGHGMYDAANGMTTIPGGTTFTMPTGLGNTISDAYGGAIESGANLSPFTNEMTGAQSYLSGSQAPNLTLSPPEGLNIQGNPTTVSTPTNLDQLLKPDMGNVQWAACCNVNPD
jgi:RHS repeat-associated protein